MRIGLNATCFNDRPSGATQRFRGIYGALIRRCPSIEFVLFEPADCRVADWFGELPNLSVRRTPIPATGRLSRAMAGLRYWRSAASKERLDIFENFSLPLVELAGCASMMTVHDIREGRPGVSPLRRKIYARVLRRALDRSERVITVSETMRQEILAFHPSARVSTVYNGIDPTALETCLAKMLETRRKFSLPENFILSVGHLEARKNYPTLIDAVGKLRTEGRDIKLVIVGNPGVRESQEGLIAEQISRLGLSSEVTLLSNVTADELAAIYGLCRMVVFPSLYEGFGIPLIEAMAARRPIVLSDTPVFRELTEGRGIYFQPHDSDALASEVGRILSSAAAQDAVVAYGTARVSDFEFETLAAQVEQIYATVA